MKPFTDVVRELSGGVAVEQLTEAVEKVVAAVKASNQKGSIELKIMISPGNKNPPVERVYLDYTYKANVPKPITESTLFFVDADDQLVRDNPKQTQMPLRDVQQPEPNIRDIDNGQ